ncbi:hypothetical protein TUM12370_16230 [Salmonella enterica subsp. enterica serovar Choleraesuis]|nr:hypothetical protein TUM12370_16230 [Salmonella enterica subsp. enterica serovar Choleraesuis]
MYQGYPDFQQIFTCDDRRFIGAWQQEDICYLYPDALAIRDIPPLAFALDIIRSQSQKLIYGRLNFTTQFQYASTQQLERFKQSYPQKAIQILPINAWRLGFYAPSGFSSSLNDNRYDPTWYSARDSEFIIVLDASAAQLVEKTLIDGIFGFNARQDGFIAGLSPRLDYRVEFNPQTVLTTLANGVPGATHQADGRTVFGYEVLTQFLDDNLEQLGLDIRPAFNPPILAERRLFCQAFLDRLFNSFGAPWFGPADSNTTYISLPSGAAGREIYTLSELTLTQRPVCFTLDPFAAAQQIIKQSKGEIIHRTTAPPMPPDALDIGLYYAFPPGLTENAALDVQVNVPDGPLYPQPQSQTEPLSGADNHLNLRFINSSFDDDITCSYQLRITWPSAAGHQSQTGPLQDFSPPSLALDSQAMPCRFLTLNIDNGLAHSALLEGTCQNAGYSQRVQLTQLKPWFSVPLPDGAPDTRIILTAYELTSDRRVELPAAVTQSATIGAWSFPQFGAQRAQITVRLPPDMARATLWLRDESTQSETPHTVSRQQPVFEYRWTVTSIFAPGFSFKTPGGTWSDYMTGDQTIEIKANP